MDQNTARTLARDAGERAALLGLPVTDVADPDCAELATECERACLPVVAVLG